MDSSSAHPHAGEHHPPTLESRSASVNAQLPPRRRRWTDRRAWVALTALFLVQWAALFQVYDGGQFIDPFNHLVYLTSLLADRDLDFANDFAAANTFDRQRRLQFGDIAPTGFLREPWPPGAALLWAPFLVPVHLGSHLMAALTGQAPPERFDFTPMAAVSLGTVAWGYVALYLLYRLARLRARPGPALAAVSAVLLCSPLPFHLFRCAASDHGLSLLTAALWLWLCLHRFGAHPRARGLWLGIAGGLMILTRWELVLLGLAGLLLIVPRLVRLTRRDRRAALAALACGLLGFLAVSGLQLVLWRIIEGRWLASPRREDFFHWSDPQLLPLLFSGKGGILHWHPALALGAVGLLLLTLRRAAWGLWLVAALAGLLFTFACVDDWHGQWGIGNRRAIALLPVLVLGLAELFTALRGKRLAVTVLAALLAVLALGNFLFMLFGHRGLIGLFNPLNEAGWASLVHFWRPLATSILTDPIPVLIDNTFFAPWLVLRREPYLAHFGLVIALLPLFWLRLLWGLAQVPRIVRRGGEAIAVLLLALQLFLLTGLRPLAPSVAATGALSTRLADASPDEARALRREVDAALPAAVSTPALFHRLVGLSHRARERAGESWDPALLTAAISGQIASGQPLDKPGLAGLLDVALEEYTPTQRMPLRLRLGDRGRLEPYWQHAWDQRLMQPLFRRLLADGDFDATREFYDLTDRAPLFWLSCLWFEAMNPPRPGEQQTHRRPFTEPPEGDDRYRLAAPNITYLGAGTLETARPREPETAPSPSSPDFALAAGALETIHLLAPLDIETLDLLIRTLRLWGPSNPAALDRARELERLARAIVRWELTRLEGARTSPLYRRAFIEDRWNHYQASPYH